MSAICNGILSERRTIWRCPKCKRRRWSTVHERYDSILIKCHEGHEWISDGTEGLHYAGKFPSNHGTGEGGVVQ
jgi:hypothetical protein